MNSKNIDVLWDDKKPLTHLKNNLGCIFNNEQQSKE